MGNKEAMVRTEGVLVFEVRDMNSHDGFSVGEFFPFWEQGEVDGVQRGSC